MIEDLAGHTLGEHFIDRSQGGDEFSFEFEDPQFELNLRRADVLVEVGKVNVTERPEVGDRFPAEC